MIKQYLRKKAMVSYGVVNTYLRRYVKAYDDKVWWDTNFYRDGISDRQTIRAAKHRVSAKYHYNSIELKILRHLYNQRVQKTPRLWGSKADDSDLFRQTRILDIGTGSGHWIDFYLSLGATELVGIDVSASAVKYLQGKYSSYRDITIHHGKASAITKALDGKFDLAIAIGVMFHITDDAEWVETIHAMANKLRNNGILVVGGHFGWLDGVNSQIDSSGHIFKRLRSSRRWRRELKRAGFSRVFMYRNNAYLWINDPLPENNVLIAEKGGA